MFDLPTYLGEKRRLIDSALDEHLPGEQVRPEILHAAMRYCVFSEGKRLRPILCLAATAACEGDEGDALLPALSLELLHTYTLIHDDLPCMDNSDLRRGQPAAHVRFGEANAVLAGDALLTMAFEWLSQSHAPAPWGPGQFAFELAQAAGSQGVIAGQVEDLAAENKPPSEADLEFIHLHKTAALIRAAVRMGAIAGGTEGDTLDALSLYGCKLGLAFQITDDLLDEIGATETVGKPTGSDRAQQKLTSVSVHGEAAAREQARQQIEEALQALSSISGPTEPLEAIARHVLTRNR